MAKHSIYARHQNISPGDRLSIPIIKKSAIAALLIENADIPCEVNILITDDETMRGLNKQYRGIDEPTDVLSFPMYESEKAGWAGLDIDEADYETGRVHLGNIIISAQRVAAQALEYDQSRDQETAYLIVHSVLHLLGYDHIDEAEQKKHMRDREKAIMKALGFEDME